MIRARERIPRSQALQFGLRLRERRKACGMTQGELATRTGVARMTVLRWEQGSVPHEMDASMVNALEAALLAPSGWLLSQDDQPEPDPGFEMANAAAHDGEDDRQTQIPLFRCREIGSHARRLRKELGLSGTDVAHACGVSRSTMSLWEAGAFRKAVTAHRFRVWERALLLEPGQLQAPPASHPRVRDGRWCVFIGTATLEAAIRDVAQILATRGCNLLRPQQPLDAQASRDADLLAHRYEVGTHRGPLAEVAITYGITPSYAREAAEHTIARAQGFIFDIPVLDTIFDRGTGTSPSTSALVDGRMREMLGPSLSLERAVAFVGEIVDWHQRR